MVEYKVVTWHGSDPTDPSARTSVKPGNELWDPSDGISPGAFYVTVPPPPPPP